MCPVAKSGIAVLSSLIAVWHCVHHSYVLKQFMCVTTRKRGGEGGGGRVGAVGWTHPACLTSMVHMQTGSKISRRSRAKDLPSRPKAGWSMVVQDVSEEGAKKQFVALPGGRSRKLTADEEVYLERMKPKRRKRII